MRSVKIRILTEICHGEWINHIEEETTYEEAEFMCGEKLDRRKNYNVVEGEVCECVQWSQTCSGCDGGGCHECGYHGNVRTGMWVPVVGGFGKLANK